MEAEGRGWRQRGEVGGRGERLERIGEVGGRGERLEAEGRGWRQRGEVGEDKRGWRQRGQLTTLSLCLMSSLTGGSYKRWYLRET